MFVQPLLKNLFMLDITNLIRRRRAIFPKFYLPGQPVDRALIEEMLENANHAPTHKLTEPWRFRVFHTAEGRERLAAHMEDFFQKNTAPEQFTEEKWKKSGDNPRRAGAVIALVLRRDPAQGVPEWEEIAALAMAVQNLWLTCTAQGLGGYWSSPKSALDGGDIFELGEGERCMGLFYIAHHEAPELPAKRGAVEEKTRWY